MNLHGFTVHYQIKNVHEIQSNPSIFIVDILKHLYSEYIDEFKHAK